MRIIFFSLSHQEWIFSYVLSQPEAHDLGLHWQWVFHMQNHRVWSSLACSNARIGPEALPLEKNESHLSEKLRPGINRAWEIQSHNAIFYTKSIFMAPSHAFCSLSWMYAGIGMICIIQSRICLIERWCLEHLEKYFLNFMNLHILVFFICIQSILILLEQRIPGNNFVLVLWEKFSLLSLLMDFYHVMFPQRNTE